MRFAVTDLLLAITFLAFVFGAVINRERFWAFALIALAIVCGVVLLSRLRKRNDRCLQLEEQIQQLREQIEELKAK
jgi:cell division protein FtsB